MTHDSTRIALVINAQGYAGPASTAALLKQDFEVVAHDTAFTYAPTREEYAAANPGAKPSPYQDPESLVNQAWDQYGRLDVLVSNDSYPAIHLPIEQTDVGDLRKTLEALVIFPYRLMQTAVPRFKLQGRGNVIMITSCRTELPLSRRGHPGHRQRRGQCDDEIPQRGPGCPRHTGQRHRPKLLLQ